jgi:hypothetical protein
MTVISTDYSMDAQWHEARPRIEVSQHGKEQWVNVDISISYCVRL